MPAAPPFPRITARVAMASTAESKASSSPLLTPPRIWTTLSRRRMLSASRWRASKRARPHSPFGFHPGATIWQMVSGRQALPNYDTTSIFTIGYIRFTSIVLKNPLGRRERIAVWTAIRGGRFGHVAKIGVGTGMSFASFLRFWAVAANRDSSLAPLGPRRRKRSSLRMRFRCPRLRPRRITQLCEIAPTRQRDFFVVP